MFRIKYDPSVPGQFLFPQIQWRSCCDKVLVTLDDSPNKGITDGLLQQLEDLQITALFFCIGRNIRQTGGMVAEIAAAGHEIGNHSFQHRNLRRLSGSEVGTELRAASDCIAEATGRRPRYFRPPYGRFSRAIVDAARAEGMQPVLWSLLTYDYKNDINLLKFTFRYLRRDAIVVLHDNTKNASIIHEGIAALNDDVHSKNFKFGTPGECLK
jgi:peptidoglycan/xylan/chitin deacetylase (PgdA/CDA1 family)